VAKVSRPIIYVAVLGAVAYAVVLLTEEKAPPKKPTTRVTASGPKAPVGFTAADMTATFPRYASKDRNAFAPKVVAKKAAANAGMTPPLLPPILTTGVWTLTGINTVDGVASALLENSSTGETVFLKQGDIWSGLQVLAIEPEAIVLVNAQGKPTRLVFAQPAEEPAMVGTVPPVVLPAPSGGTVVLPGTRAASGNNTGNSVASPTPSAPTVPRPTPMVSERTPSPLISPNAGTPPTDRVRD
jgi:hypothetical protein